MEICGLLIISNFYLPISNIKDIMFSLQNTIIIVSGLPRSGTSMMMQMLDAMNIPLFTDQKRVQDESNPNGYYEHEIVKNLQNDSSWLPAVKGKAVKILSHLLIHLPADYQYKIIFMKRNLDEIIKSQNKMLMLNDPDFMPEDDMILKNIFEKNLKETDIWAAKNSNVDLQYFSYADIINNPVEMIEKLSYFLNLEVNGKEIARIVNKDFYRSRL